MSLVLFLLLKSFLRPCTHQVHQEQIAASEMTENIAEIPVVQEQVIVGTRPERLVDAPGPQRCDRTVRGTSVGAPVLAVQSLRGFEGVDDTAAKFLLQQALKEKTEEEEEERRLAVALEKEKLKVAMKSKEVEAVEESSGGSSAAPAAPAEPFMPRRVFEVVKKGCIDMVRSPLASTAAKADARKRLAKLLDQERRGGVG